MERAPAWLPWALTAVAFALFLWAGLAVQATRVPTVGNLAMDFDVPRFMALWCGDNPAPANQSYFAPRHPLALIGRPFCLGAQAAGAPLALAAALFPALCGAAAVGFAYGVARRLGARGGEAVALAALLGGGNAALTVFSLPEAYGPALMGMTAQLFALAGALAASRAPGPASPAWLFAGVTTLGITITNFGLTLLSAAAVALKHGLRRAVLLRLVGILALISVLVAAGAVVALGLVPSPGIDSPVAFVKQLWWSSHAGAPLGLPFAKLLSTFALHAAVAPPLDRVVNLAPDLPLMFDYRSGYAGGLGPVLAALWAVLCAGGAVAGLASRRWRLLTLVALGWIAFNLALHSAWQMRGSLFLYASHGSAAWWLLAALGYLGLRDGLARRAPAAAFAALALFAATLVFHNAQALAAFVRAAA